MEWKDLLLEDDAAITKLLADTKRVAVLGIKSEEKSGQPSFYVPQALQGGLMVLRRDALERAGGIEQLGDTFADDVRAGNVLQRADVPSPPAPFPTFAPAVSGPWCLVLTSDFAPANIPHVDNHVHRPDTHYTDFQKEKEATRHWFSSPRYRR